jgi:hypothetical protein
MNSDMWYFELQTFICLFSALILYAMWRRGIPKADKVADEFLHDSGLLWLGRAVLVWSIAGAWPLLHYLPGCENIGQSDEPFSLSIIRECLSTLNSAFLLLAIAHFEHGWKGLKRFQNKEWHVRIIATAIIVALLIVLTPPTPSFLRATPEFILSLATVFILAWALFESFIERSFKILAYLSAFASLVMLATQVTDYLIKLGFIENNSPILPEWQCVLLLASKTIVIFTILSLPMTWAYVRWRENVIKDDKNILLNSATVTEQSNQEENLHFQSESSEFFKKELIDRLTLNFSGKEEEPKDSKRPWSVLIKIDDYFAHASNLSEKNHERLLMFALQRITVKDDGYLAMNNRIKTFDLTDISRICEQIGIKKHTLFESKNDCFRLKVSKSNLNLSPLLPTHSPWIKNLYMEMEYQPGQQEIG